MSTFGRYRLEEDREMGLTEEGLVQIPGLLSRWVNLPTGVRAHYVTAGETGPAVVLLHGGIIGSSGTAGFRFMAPFLGEHGFRVYCPDMPSFGLTVDPNGAYAPGPGGHVDFLHDFVNTLALDRFHLAGNSMGCMNTVNYVVAHNERVMSFAMVAGPVGDIVPGQYREWFNISNDGKRPNTRQFDGTVDSMRRMMEAIILRKEEISDDLLEMRTRAARLQADAYSRHVEARDAIATGENRNLASRLSTIGRLNALEIPAIYLFGKEDRFPIEMAYPQEDALPNVQFFYPEDCGHQGQTDQPEMFNQLFLEFFGHGSVTEDTAKWAGVSTRRPQNSRIIRAAEEFTKSET
jgi:2-hydroxy-6-oxonona-2,4-dienedioate hydrolase